MSPVSSIALFVVALASTVACVSDRRARQEVRRDDGNAHQVTNIGAATADARSTDGSTHDTDAACDVHIDNASARTDPHEATKNGSTPSPRNSSYGRGDDEWTPRPGTLVREAGLGGGAGDSNSSRMDASVGTTADATRPIEEASPSARDTGRSEQPDHGITGPEASATGDGSIDEQDAIADSVRPPASADDSTDSASLWASASLPAFDTATLAHVKAVLAEGTRRGNRQTVFARCGDSITATPNFLVAVGQGSYVLGAYTALEPAIALYRAFTLPDGTNSFTHATGCAVGGWTTANALAPPGAIAAELDALEPSVLFVLFGTNDSQQLSVAQFATNLGQLADLAESHASLLVLSTAPPRTDYASGDAVVETFNAIIRQTTSSRLLPLIDLHAALLLLPARGIGSDGVHPTVEMVAGKPASGDFAAPGLQYGYNARNLLTIQMLDRLRLLR